MLTMHRNLLVATLFLPLHVAADDAREAKLKLGASFLELGGTVAALMWTSNASDIGPTSHPDDVYRLARDIQLDLDRTRASSNFGIAMGNTGAAALTVLGHADPEPISKGIFYVGAYVAHSSANYLAEATYQQTQARSLGLLRNVLDEKQNKLTPGKLAAMDKAEVVSMVDGLRLGNKAMREVFKDNPEALELLKANLNDYLVSNSAAALFQVKKIDSDVSSMRKDLVKVAANLKEFNEKSIQRFNDIEAKTDALLKATKNSALELEKLDAATRGNTLAIQALSDISYLGWNTDQKLAAIKAGQFPKLEGPARESLIASLEADKKREAFIGDLQKVGRDLSSLSSLAENLGMDKGVVTALNYANTANMALLKFASGDVLGTVATLSSLFAKQKADPAAERHKELMNYLSKQFGQVNERLLEIQRLQEETLEAVYNLSKFMVDFRKDIHQQLSGIEDQVLRSNAMLQAIIRAEWRPCRAMRAASNGQVWFSNRQEVLLNVLGPSDSAKAFRGNWLACNSVAFNFLNGDIAAGDWAGGIADMRTSVGAGTADGEQMKALSRYADLRINEYRAARDVLRLAAPDMLTSPAPYLLRLGQPSPSVSVRDAMNQSLLSKSAAIESFTCNTTKVLNAGMRDLVCYGLASSSNYSPLQSQVANILGDTLIGPNGWSLMDSMISVSRTAAFVRLSKESDQYLFLSPQDFDTIRPATEALKSSVGDPRGLDLLRRILPMAELNILQQSVAYGDFVPQLVLDILYDEGSKSLIRQVNPLAPESTRAKQAAALKAMDVSPILGRNVVMLAVRKALIGADGHFPTSYYGLALANLSGKPACERDPVSRGKLTELLPNWKIEYRAAGANLSESISLGCTPEDANKPRGAGAVLDFGSFYVRMPASEVADAGVFETPQSLHMALSYRAKIGEELVDRNAYKYGTSLNSL